MEKKEKKIILEEKCPNQYNTPSIYCVPDIIGWYLDGFNLIEVYPERKRVFLYFASANGILDITSDGISYVAGMKII